MIELLFIRHGATAGNLKRRYIGRTDEPLCAAGMEQVKMLRECGLRADRLFVSPMLRTRQTAELLFPGMAYTAIDGLRETDFGIFEGKTAAELSGNPEYRAWVDSGCQAEIPGGDSVKGFRTRCCRAFAAAMETVPDGTAAAFVIHGGGIMAILAAYVRPARDFYTFHIGTGESVRCVYSGGVILLE